jgi:hypothetical protein
VIVAQLAVAFEAQFDRIVGILETWIAAPKSEHNRTCSQGALEEIHLARSALELNLSAAFEAHLALARKWLAGMDREPEPDPAAEAALAETVRQIDVLVAELDLAAGGPRA